MLNKLLKELVKKDWPQTIVEVGAGDGVYSSLSRPFLEKGWRGVLIEPQIDLAVKLYDSRFSFFTEVLCCAVGLDFEYKALHLTTSPNWATFNPSESPKSYFKKEVVPVHPLRNILYQQKVQKDFSILIVDTEGDDLDVIESLGPYYLPRIIVTEVWSYNSKKYKRKIRLLNELGYVFLTRVGWDDVYIYHSYFTPTEQQFLINQ